MFMLRPQFILTSTLCLLIGGAVFTADAQTFQQRMEHFRKQRRAQEARNLAKERALAQKINRVSVERAMRTRLPAVSIEGIAMRDAFDWLQEMSGVKIVINWRTLEALGVNPQQAVSISGSGLTTEQVLKLLLLEIGPDIDMVVEETPWYVRVMTKEEANSKAVVRVYGIGDLLQRIPNFEEAPKFDLAQITQATQGGSGPSGGLFTDSDQDEEEEFSKQERADQIADLIRQTVEPELWQKNGGLHGSIAVWRDMLVVRAPMYVQRQIGLSSPLVSSRPTYGPATAPGYVSRSRRYVNMNMRIDSGQLTRPIRRVNVYNRRRDAGILPN